jgi:hypothetical protein
MRQHAFSIPCCPYRFETLALPSAWACIFSHAVHVDGSRCLSLKAAVVESPMFDFHHTPATAEGVLKQAIDSSISSLVQITQVRETRIC